MNDRKGAEVVEDGWYPVSLYARIANVNPSYASANVRRIPTAKWFPVGGWRVSGSYLLSLVPGATTLPPRPRQPTAKQRRRQQEQELADLRAAAKMVPKSPAGV